jgi:hypothetical protein
MKKIYVLALTILFIGAAMGQSSMTFPKGKVLDQKQISKIKLGQNHSNSKSTERWYNYGEAMDLILGGTAAYAGNMLFPDSTISVVYTGGVLKGPWIHKLADVFDPTVIMFNDATIYPGEMAIGKRSTYTLDSIQVDCFYLRGYKTPTAVDTLIFDVAIIDAPTATSGYVYFDSTSQVSINLHTKKTKFVDVLYNQPTNSFNMNPHTTYKVPLTAITAADTLANGLNLISCVPNLTIDSFKIVVVSVAFKPGYTWTFMDSLNSYNRFRFLSLNEGPGVFPTYTVNDWNVSYIIPQDVRYNTAGNWNGEYIPSFAYLGQTNGTNDYDYLHHSIYYKCTGLTNVFTTSIQENNADGNMLGNAYPNPVNGNFDLIIPVTTNDANASIVISNVVGQVVMNINTINNGQVHVNTSALINGLYFYTLNSGKNTTTKRFTVIK